MNIHQAISALVDRVDLSENEMNAVMTEIMTGQCTSAQIGAFLVALRMKGETVEEITGAARVMRQLATPVELDEDHLVDTCGTGGDEANLFNVSTAGTMLEWDRNFQVLKRQSLSRPFIARQGPPF